MDTAASTPGDTQPQMSVLTEQSFTIKNRGTQIRKKKKNIEKLVQPFKKKKGRQLISNKYKKHFKLNVQCKKNQKESRKY